MPKHVTETTGASIEAVYNFTTGKAEFDAGAELTVDAGTTTNLARSGANSDITSLGGLTTPLSVAQGGTDAATAAGARAQLDAAKLGVNDDITALEGLTFTQYGIAYRGTGGTLTASSTAVSPYQEVASGSNGEPTWRDKEENVVIVVTAPDVSPTEVSKAAQFYMPFGGFVSAVHAGVSTDSSTKDIKIDVDMGGTSIFTTKLYIDAGELTSATAATVAVIGAGVSSFAQWARCDLHVDACGTTAEGLVVTLKCVRTD